MRILLLFLIFLFSLCLFTPSSAWVSGYDHRMPIEINNTGDNKTYFNYNFTMDTASLVAGGKMNINGSDCYITNGTDIFQNFWNETSYNSSTNLWINATALGNITNTTHYIYYNKPSASDVTNGTATFLLFDNFTGVETDGFENLIEASLWSNASPDDWLGRPCLENYTTDSVWIATYVRGEHRTNPGSQLLHIRFSQDEGVTWTAEDTYTDGSAVGGFPMSGHNTYAVGEALLIVTPNNDLLIMNIETKDFTIGSADMNGVYQWRSTDGGGNWTDEGQVFPDSCLQIADYAIANADIYIPIEYDPSGDYTSPACTKLYNSSDNGGNWTFVSNITEMTDCPPCLAWPETGIEYCGNNTFLTIIRAATSYSKTLQRISTDLGATWGALEDVTGDVGIVRGRAQLSKMPGEPNRIYLSTRNQAASPEGIAILYTDNNGTSWSNRFILNTSSSLSTDYVNIIKRTNGTYYALYAGGTSTVSNIRESTFKSILCYDVDSTKWDLTGSPVISSGSVQLSDDDIILSKTTHGFGTIVTANSKADEQDSSFVGYYTDSNNKMAIENSDYVADDDFDNIMLVIAKAGSYPSPWPQNQWTDFRTTFNQYTIKRINTSYIGYSQGSNSSTFTDSAKIPTGDMKIKLYVWDSSQESTLTTDWVFVRKSGDVTVSLGAEESAPSNAPIITLLSQTPSTICRNCTGNISIEYGISHDSVGLNNTSVSFIYRDYDHDLSDSNHSIRPPTNDLASEWNYDGRILRGTNRNESLNFENNATITGGDTYSWSGLDENSTEVSIVSVNSTYTKVYINSTIHRVMPQMHYIDRSELQEAPKTTIAIHKNQDVLVKFWSIEIPKGNTDFLGVGYTDTTLNTNPALRPSDANPVNYYYISSGYDPATGSDPLTSGYAVYMGSLNATGWVDHVYSPHANSSYTRGFINNTLLHSYINTTNISYVLYTSNTPSNKGYLINVTDVATSSNVSFANTSVLWAGDDAMSLQSYTPNIWFAFMKDNVSFDHKLYVADNNDLWGNSTINSTTVGEALFPPTKPSFYSFHNGVVDYDMNGTYSGTFNVQISAGSDPDGGDVVHNVSLYYGNGTCIDSIFNTSCNASCLYMNVSFDSTPYYSDTENYTFKVVATDDEGESVTTWLGVNFSLGLHVSGTVYGGDNIGLPDVSITLGTYSTTTASDGTFLFTGISDGLHTLTSYIDGYDTLSKTVIVSGADVTGQDFYYDIIVDRGGGGGSGGYISIIEVLDEDGEVIGKAIAIGKPGEALFTIDLISVSRLLSGIDAKDTWIIILILSIISILAGLFDTSKTTRPEFLLIIGFVGIGFYAIYQSKLAIVIGFG